MLIKKLLLAGCLALLASQAAPPPLVVTVEHPVITVEPALEDYDIAILRCDLKVNNKSKTPTQIRVSKPFLITAYLHPENNAAPVILYQTHVTFHFLDDTGQEQKQVLKSNVSYVYKQLSERIPIRRSDKAVVGLRYGSQEVSFDFGLPPAQERASRSYCQLR